MNNRRSGVHQKRDAKKMTMRRLSYYDSDLVSRYDDDDDGQVRSTIFTD